MEVLPHGRHEILHLGRPITADGQDKSLGIRAQIGAAPWVVFDSLADLFE
jgi:hypothetical protein